MPAGEVASSTNPQCFYVPNENNDNIPPPPIIRRTSIPKLQAAKVVTPTVPLKSKSEQLTMCDVCQGEGNNANLVRLAIAQKNSKHLL